jgi:hypothetical protein
MYQLSFSNSFILRNKGKGLFCDSPPPMQPKTCPVHGFPLLRRVIFVKASYKQTKKKPRFVVKIL